MMHLWQYMSMNRTTIQLENVLASELKKLAHEQRKSISAVINDLLRRALGTMKSSGKQKPVFSWATASAKPAAGFDPSDRSTYLDVLDEGF